MVVGRGWVCALPLQRGRWTARLWRTLALWLAHRDRRGTVCLPRCFLSLTFLLNPEPWSGLPAGQVLGRQVFQCGHNRKPTHRLLLPMPSSD